MRRAIRSVAVAATLLALAACGSTPAPAYQPSIANLQALRVGMKPIGVDDFSAAAGVNDSRLGVRADSMTGAGGDGAFSTYLQQALETELRNAGRFDAEAGLRLSGVLIENRLDASGFSVGRASVGARFVLTRDGVVIYDKAHNVEHEWESSFMGALAIPAAMQGYAGAMQKLTGQLFADPTFVEATR